MGAEHWLQLALANGLGPVTLKRLLEATGSPEAACTASLTMLRWIEGLGKTKSEQIYRGLLRPPLRRRSNWQRAEELQVRVVAFDDPLYPPLLRSIHDPPPVLFVRGTLEPRDLNAIAIVGSRGCSFYGREQAERFARLAGGMRLHDYQRRRQGHRLGRPSRGAVASRRQDDRRTRDAEWMCVYPPENEKLFDQISERGAVISEYPLGTQPLADNFPRRNRIVSGMSRGVLVIEADRTSGALITAHTACEQDRTVFALPGRIDNRMSAGPHKLIREGATLVTGVQDIFDGLTPVPADLHELPDGDLFSATIDATEITEPPRPSKPPVQTTATKVPVTAQQEQVLGAIEDQATTC